MTRFKVITLSFLVGLVVGLSVPAHASESFTEKVIAVDVDNCTVELDSGDVYQIECDEAEDLKPGSEVTMTIQGHDAYAEPEQE